MAGQNIARWKIQAEIKGERSQGWEECQPAAEEATHVENEIMS